MKEKVGIVIVNYNGREYQNECIRSIYEMNYRNFEIIVVDSNSQDDSVKMLLEEFPNVTVLIQNENVGVARGNNIGIKYVIDHGMEYTLLLNNDTVLDKNLLSNLLCKASEKTITVPKIYYYNPSNLLWFAGGNINWKKIETVHEKYRETESIEETTPRYITYSPTCCMLIHNSIFQNVGMIDENYFMYYDDTDFCVRLIENGVSILYVPEAKLWHKVSSSTGGEASPLKTYYISRNYFYFEKKFKYKTIITGRFYQKSKMFIKYVLSYFYKKQNKYIWNAYRDYRKGKMGRKDYL